MLVDLQLQVVNSLNTDHDHDIKAHQKDLKGIDRNSSATIEQVWHCVTVGEVESSNNQSRSNVIKNVLGCKERQRREEKRRKAEEERLQKEEATLW